jgi:GntR family transcriptional regulator/MocR family aminotransferase
LRLAYFVVPIQQVERIARISETFEGGSPELTQSIVAAFMREGHFARHIQKMRRLYSSRRDATVAGLRRVLGSVMRIESPPGGMHLILRLRGRRSDRALAALMRENGLFAEPLFEWSVDHKQDAALLVNFTNVDSVTTAEVLGRRILALL